MRKKPITILGINPGSKYLGIARLEDSVLMDWRIRALKGRWSKEKMFKVKTIISCLVEQYRPYALAIKKLNPRRSSPELDEMARQIIAFAADRNIRVYEYSIKDLESFLSPDKKINKKKLSEIITLKYPILYHELAKEKNHLNPYHIRMFEAVALGAVCFHQLDNHIN